MMALHAIFLLVCMVMWSHGQKLPSEEYTIQRFDLDEKYPPIKLLLDDANSTVYISAVNRLYQLNKTLDRSTLIEVITGPKNDYIRCLPYERCHDADDIDMLAPTDNYNKLFLMDSAQDRLIVCGSIYQGICQARSMFNISDVVSDKPCKDNFDCPYDHYFPIACLDANCTCVGVIAEGPTLDKPVLYIATTAINNIFSSHRNTISTRSLYAKDTYENKLFGLAISTPVSENSRLLVPSEGQDGFTASFKYTFATEGLNGFVYFLYLKEGSSGTIMARLCKKDPMLRSYITLNMACGESGDKVEVINAYYKKRTGSRDWNIDDGNEGSLYVTFKNAKGSSFCVYTLRAINKAFDDGIITCYKRNGRNSDRETVVIADPELNGNNYIACPSDTPWMGQDARLNDSTAEPITIYLEYYKHGNYKIEDPTYRCGASYLPKGLKVLTPLTSNWSYHQDRTVFSGLTVDLIDGINTAFISTADGDIIELNVNHKNVFNTITIGSPIVGNLVLDNHPSLPLPHLYVMTSKEVSIVKVSVCSKHTTCSDCLQAKDPYCGWCILSSSCVPKSTPCPSNSFLNPLSKQCIEATVQAPLERSLQQNVTIQAELLPAISSPDSYTCLFNGKYSSPARVKVTSSRFLICKAPASDSLPGNNPGEDYVDVSLSILYNDQTEIVSTIVKFYQCEAHGKTVNVLQPCKSCLDNQWKGKCSWCIKSNMCVPNIKGSSCLSSDGLCPTITTGNRSLVVSAGIGTEITLDVKNLPAQAANQMSCIVLIEGNPPVQVKATLLDNSRTKVKCQRQQYQYNQNKSEVSATVSVNWKPNFAVDIQSFSPIAFYKCEVSHGDCSLCVTANPEYKCGWCGNKCVIKELCSQTWVRDYEHCTDPVITSFDPVSGPLTGNTTVTINGHDLGVKADDVANITIAGVECIQLKEDYRISNRIKCVLKSPATLRPKKDKVALTVRGIKAISNDEFSFKSPILRSVTTPEGPVSGGTLVEIVGNNLDVGGNKIVYIDRRYECSNPEVLSATVMTCESSAAEWPSMNLSLSVLFDGHAIMLPNAYSYLPDPEVTSYATASGKLACFLAGGRDVVFTGRRLNLIQRADLMTVLRKNVVDKISAAGRVRRHVLFRNHFKSRLRRSANDEFLSFSSECKVENKTRMVCSTPKIDMTSGNNEKKNNSDSVLVHGALRLRMDNINEDVIDPTSGRPATLTYYPNPNVLDLEPEVVKALQAKAPLNIHVVNLNLDAVDESEIVIMIEDQRCPVVSIKDEVVRCDIPEKPPGDETTFPVTVQIGNKMWEIGRATYVAQQKPFPTAVIVVLCVAIALALGLVVFCCVRKQKHYRINKNDFQKAIENLEMTVQADFRKAFAELSIDMTDLAADTGDVGIPVLSYRQYATNMFFPTYHPCMKEPIPNDNGVHQGYVQFDLLIANKQFLMAFIRTLEQQRGFSNRDKANVASLITVVLHKRLDYFAEVMKSLVSELVAASVERNPKVLLRRTESVAERMLSNWLAICLFQHIRDDAGKPLFVLQKAIKHQVSKGPLDAISGKTKYTLSDDSLLKEDIPCDSLTLFVSQRETDPDDPIVVKVLSCDSIPQVKEKIMDAVYKKIPFSQRPKAEQLDLEWRHGRSGHLILPDNDHVNEQGSRWRRVMTIKDYKVDGNATMTLVQREQKIDDADTSHYTNNSADTSVVSPMLPEDNVKVYHLVKYSDELEQKQESRDKHKHILDLYLLRLISMKGILQSYVDDAFNSILDTNSVPPAVKHFFDFLDELAKSHDISNQEITHIWKTNSVLGRFWVTLLKNPELVFDVDKPESVASSMAVISQTFIDACSVQEHQPTKDSPINKQLYAKEIPSYKKLVQKYYAEVRQMQPVSDQDMCAHMTEISRSHDLEFDVHVAHKELWGYVNKYFEEIQETLSNDPNMAQMVIQRLQQVYHLNTTQ